MYSLSCSDKCSLFLFCGRDVSGLLCFKVLKCCVRKNLEKTVRKYKTVKILFVLFGIKLCQFYHIIRANEKMKLSIRVHYGIHYMQLGIVELFADKN